MMTIEAFLIAHRCNGKSETCDASSKSVAHHPSDSCPENKSFVSRDPFISTGVRREVHDNLFPLNTDSPVQMVKILQEFRLEISAIFLIFSLFLMIVVITGNFFQDTSPDLLKRVHEDVGGWLVWLDVVAPIMFLIAGYYVVVTIRMSREFARLIDTKSKATFIKNQDRLEELAFNLTESHRRSLQEKKEELKIKI